MKKLILTAAVLITSSLAQAASYGALVDCYLSKKGTVETIELSTYPASDLGVRDGHTYAAVTPRQVSRSASSNDPVKFRQLKTLCDSLQVWVRY